jgi:signal transduction histidine kinase
LVDKNGFPLGNLCVIDNQPNKISEKKLDALKILSNQVVKLIELRKANALLKKSKSELKIINQNLQDFAHVVSHDLKAPVRHVLQYSELINDEVNEGEKKHIGKHLQKIEDSATEALELIDGILRYSRSINSYDISTSNIMISKMIEDIFDKCNDSDHIRCIVCLDQNEINISRITLSQILTNIISNAVKYIDKSSGLVKITVSVDEENYNFEIKDNGIGIQEDKLGIIFNLFYMVEDRDLAHINRNGIGLNIVKKLIQNCGGTISVKSQRGVGSVFSFSIPKNAEN